MVRLRCLVKYITGLLLGSVGIDLKNVPCKVLIFLKS